MGVAIAMTGRSTMISFIIAAIFVLGTTLPAVFVAGTLRLRGGQYTQAALLGNTTLGGIVMFLSFFMQLSLAMYALSFADYFFRFFPGIPSKLVAISVFTLFWLLNMFGIEKFAKVQNVMVTIMCLGLAVFAAFGANKIQPGFFGEGFFTNGFKGVLQAAALLTFATGGAMIIINLSGESKNPTKHIPIVLVLSTVLVAIFYAFMAVVATGILPVEEVAGKPLTAVAETILPKPLFMFFMVGGALFGLVKTINSQLASSTKPMLQASVDGWVPQKLSYIHPRFKTPMVWLTIFYIMGIIPIITGLDIGDVANIVLIVGNIMNLVINFLLFRLPKVAPEAWEQSKFKICNKKLYLVCFTSILCGAITIGLLISSSSPIILILNGAMLLVSIVYCYFRQKSGKVHMEVSYELQ
jgi:APA family basic amino acid/polyamine antiporter